MTQEERFILKLYEEASKSGSPLGTKDRFKMGSLIGVSAKVTEVLVNVLAKANFVKKIGEKGVALTERGKELALSLRS